MEQKMRYLYMEIKKTLRLLPRMLLQAVLLMVLIGMAAFCGARSMGREPLAVGADIAVVVRDDEAVTRMALNYVENMESVSQMCRFRQTTKEEGLRLLEKGEVAALILLPEQLVEGIMGGANPTVDIYFPKNAGLEAMLFRELTQSGEGLLRVAQAQVYGAGDTAREYGLAERLSGIEAEIDSFNLAFALDRLALYDTENVSAFGTMNIIQFYLASGIVLFLLLAGMAMYPVVRKEPPAFRRQLERQGLGMAWQCFCQWFCGLLCMGLLAGILWTAAGLVISRMPDTAVKHLMVNGAGGYSAGARTGIMALIVVTAATFIYLLHSAAGSRTSGILLVFMLSVVMVYLSGGLVPSMFLPKAVRAVGGKLPTAGMIQAAGGLLAGRSVAVTWECAASLCGYTAVSGLLAYLLRCRAR